MERKKNLVNCLEMKGDKLKKHSFKVKMKFLLIRTNVRGRR